MENAELLTPPPALLSHNPFLWFRFFGPGAIIASVTIGSGELIFPSRGGSMFGYRLLWVFLLVTLMKWVMAYCSMRHMILSGGHPLERWTSVPGPKGWLNLFIMITVIVTIPLTYAFLAGILGTACVWIFGVGNHYFWASICIGAAILLLILGDYHFLEKAQTLILSLKVGCILVAVFYLRPDWLAVAKGMLLPHSLVYPDWLFRTLPEMRDRSVWVEVLVYVSVIGGGSTDYLAYASFLRDKKWGWSHMGLASKRQLDHIAQLTEHPVRLWLRAALVDTLVSFAMVVVISSSFCILGTIVLQPQHLVPEGINLLNYQASFLTALSPWLLPLYKTAVFFAFFASLYGGPELAHRLIFEMLNTVPRWRDRLPARQLRAAIIAWCLGGGVVVLWLSRLLPGVQLIDIFTPVAIYTGALLSGFYTLANPWMDWHFLPGPLRMPIGLSAFSLFAGMAFIAAGLKALWDYGQLSAYLILAAVLLACIFMASCMRFLYRVQEA